MVRNKRTCHLDLIALRDPKLVIHEDDLLLREHDEFITLRLYALLALPVLDLHGS